jgi:hypothetical protein
MENKYYLYRHIRLDKNEPFYIGIGTKRKHKHFSVKAEYNRAYETNRKESHIWNNIVSKTSFNVEIIFESNNYDYIKTKEKEFILLYGRININTGCLANLTDGGDGFIGYVRSKEQIEKHKKLMIGRTQTEEEKAKRKKSKEGYKHSEETKNKISQSNKGKKIAPEHLEKLWKGQILANSKPVLQFDLEGNFIKEWQSATVAAREINLHPTSIRHCVQGKTNTSGGYLWKEQISYK